MSAQEEKKRGLFGRLFGGAPASAPAPSPEAAPEVEQTPAEVSPPVETAPSAVIIAEAPAAVVEKPEPAQKGGWFSRLKAGLTKTSSKLSEGITGLFTKSRLDVDTLDDLAVQFHHHAQHAMRGWVLGTKVDGVVLDLRFARSVVRQQFIGCGRHFFTSPAFTGDGAPGASGLAFSSPGRI